MALSSVRADPAFPVPLVVSAGTAQALAEHNVDWIKMTPTKDQLVDMLPTLLEVPALEGLRPVGKRSRKELLETIEQAGLLGEALDRIDLAQFLARRRVRAHVSESSYVLVGRIVDHFGADWRKLRGLGDECAEKP